MTADLEYVEMPEAASATDITFWPKWEAFQAEYILSRVKYPQLCGGIGSGKSWALCMRAILCSVETDIFGDMMGLRGMLGCWDLSEFKKTTMNDFFELLPEAWIESWNGAPPMRLTLKGGKNEMGQYRAVGSEIYMVPFSKFKVGGNFAWIGLDQFELFDLDTFKKLLGRIRMSKTKYGVPIPSYLRSIFTTRNPNGPSWQFKKWELNRRQRERGEGYDPQYWARNVSTYDNQHNLPPDYLPELEKNYTPKELRIHIMGSHEAYEGQVYDEWNDQLCTNFGRIGEGQVVPDTSWQKIVGLDYGFPSAKVATFIARDAAWNSIIYDEIVLEDCKIEEFMAEVKALMLRHEREMAEQEGREYVPGVLEKINCFACDPSMGRKVDDRPDLKITDAYQQAARRLGFNIGIVKADNDITAGNDLVNWLFWNCNPGREHLAHCRVNERARRHREQFEAYHFDPRTGRPSDKPTDFIHPCDAARYGLITMYRGYRPQMRKKKRNQDLPEHARIIQEMRSMRTPEEFREFADANLWTTSGWVHNN